MSVIANSIPHAVYPLGLGLLTTSSIFFGNIGLSLAGPLPIIKGELGEMGLNGKQKLGIWQAFFDQAAKYVVRGTLLTAALHLLALPLLPTQNLKSLSATSAVLSLCIFPYTGVVIMPTIKSLKTLDEKDELTPAEERETVRLISKWDTQHKVRFAMYGLAWTAGLAAFVGVLAL
ncbi:MAG: hypothetical protein M1818_007385 [Claussenomyces sp. TS43310]|nr:MAG: hypothetical protein M1818_007385 [Claussenomyces sp. TS43310]